MEHLDSGCTKKSRKPYTLTKVRESWTNDEHERFIKALQLYNRDWKKIESYVGTKTVVQIRSHAQKYFQKVIKTGSTDAIPPPRPKRRATDAPMTSQASSAFPEAKCTRWMSEASTRGTSTRDVDSDEGQQNSKPENATSLRSSDAVEAPAQLESSRAIVSCQGLQQVYLFLASLFGQLPANHAAMLQRLNSRDRQMVVRLLRVMNEELAQQQTESKETGTAVVSGGNTITTTAAAGDAATTATEAAQQPTDATEAAAADDAMQQSALAVDGVEQVQSGAAATHGPVVDAADAAAAEAPTAAAGAAVPDAAASPVAADAPLEAGSSPTESAAAAAAAGAAAAVSAAQATAADGGDGSSDGTPVEQAVQCVADQGVDIAAAASAAAAAAGAVQEDPQTGSGASQQQRQQCGVTDMDLDNQEGAAAAAAIPAQDEYGAFQLLPKDSPQQQHIQAAQQSLSPSPTEQERRLLQHQHQEQQQRHSQSVGPGGSSSDAAVPEIGECYAAAEAADAAMVSADVSIAVLAYTANEQQQQQQ